MALIKYTIALKLSEKSIIKKGDEFEYVEELMDIFKKHPFCARLGLEHTFKIKELKINEFLNEIKNYYDSIFIENIEFISQFLKK
jgi:hypothetical protein